METFFALDIVYGWRLALHDLLAGFSQQKHWYGDRQPFQVAALLLLSLLFVSIWFAVVRRFRGGIWARIGITGLLFSVVLWLLEVISFHHTDRTLYHQVQGTMVISLLWLLAAGMTALGVLQRTHTV